MDYCTKTKRLKLNPRESRVMKETLEALRHVVKISDGDDVERATNAIASLEAVSSRCVHPAEPKKKADDTSHTAPA